MLNNLKELKFEDLSQIKVNIYMGNSDKISYSKIMVIKHSGKYGFGSSGNGDATYMYAMGKAALSAWTPSAVILDWTDLEYEWGDMLEMVLDVGVDMYIDASFPTAVVVGTKCEDAVRTLLLGVDSKDKIDSIEWISRDLSSAWAYLDCQLGKKRK